MENNNIRYLYLTDPTNKKRTLAIARTVDAGYITYAFCINRIPGPYSINPKGDTFSKRMARTILQARLDVRSYLLPEPEERKVVVYNLLKDMLQRDERDVPRSAKQIIESNLHRFASEA